MPRKHKKEKEKKNYLFEEILRALEHAGKPLNYKQVCSRIGIEDKSQKMHVHFLLRDLTKKKILAETAHHKFYPADNRKEESGTKGNQKHRDAKQGSAKTITGKVDMTASGAAYIISEESEKDVYVAKVNTLNAVHGDTVRVRLAGRNGKPEGIIEEVLERSKTEFVGTVQLSRDFAFLVPDSAKIPFDIYIPKDKLHGAKDGQKAVAKIFQWTKPSPGGEILRVLGEAGKNDTEIHAILEEFGLPYTFTKQVLHDAEKIPAEITKEEISRRRDFRSVITFTIDPHDAKDFDDAISVRKLPNGNWEIGVHIADVAHYLKEGSILDREAFRRGTSVYLVDRVVPMLPEVLSNELCSLRPNEEKLCFSAVFEMDEQARVRSRWFGRTVIESDHRFTYEEAQFVIETGKGPLAREILLLDRLAKKLREERFRKGSIAFDKLEVKFHLNETGDPTGVFFKQMKDANFLIEDFMLLANKEVAQFCSTTNLPDRQAGDHRQIGAGKQQTMPQMHPFGTNTFVYRVHDKPDMEKLKAFAEIAARFGYKINLKNEETIAQSMNRALKDVAGKPEANMIEMLAIRTMAKAIYTTQNIGHYGLGFKHYTHFTSPIRRYPDVIVHRLLAQRLSNPKSQSANPKTLEDHCKHSSLREKMAAEAERASIRYKQVQFLKKRIGEEFEGMISGVTEWGIFVELSDNHCEGLVRMRDMPGYYTLDERNYCLINRRTKEKLTLGDKVRIEVKNADLLKKQLDFLMVE